MADGIAPYLVENTELERERERKIVTRRPISRRSGRILFILWYARECGKKVTVVAEKLDDLLYATIIVMYFRKFPRFSRKLAVLIQTYDALSGFFESKLGVIILYRSCCVDSHSPAMRCKFKIIVTTNESDE